MAEIKYFKIPFWRRREVEKNLMKVEGVSYSRVGHKKYYKLNDMVVSIDRDIATVVHDSVLCDNKVSKLFL